MAFQDQFQYVQLDERERYKTRLRMQRINDGANPTLAQTIKLVDHASRIFCISNLEELHLLTIEYEYSFDPGNLAFMPNLLNGETRMFIWVNNVAMWQEINFDMHAHTGLQITKIDNDVRVAETGSVIHYLKVNWETTMPIIAQSLNLVGEVHPALRSTEMTDLNLYEDTEIKLTVADAKVTSTASTYVLFRDKIFFGTSAKESVTEADILSFNSRLEPSMFIDTAFNCSDEYIYFAIPKNMGIPRFIVFELQNNDWQKSSIVIKNKHGIEVEYDIYRSENKQNSSNITISIF